MKYNKSHGIHQAGFLLEIQWQNTWYNSDLNYYFFIILSCSGGNLGFPIRIYYWLLVSNWNLKHKICTGPMSISTKFAIKWFSSFRKEDENEKGSRTWQQTKSDYVFQQVFNFVLTIEEKQCLSPLKLWLWFLPMTKCVQYNFVIDLQQVVVVLIV
jgi:hypothetical protein